MSTVFDEDRPCTIQELDNIITAPSAGLTMYPSNAFDKVCKGVYIGEGDSATSIARMKRLGVTHVLNAALGKDAFHVNTNHVMYKKAGIQFLGVEATDFINCDMSKYFGEAAEFIDSGVQSGGMVFVHCVQGVSRSATLVLAYLMIKCHMTVQDAVRLVRQSREICPNPGFLQQLCDLNEKLKKAGHFEHSNGAEGSGDVTEQLENLQLRDTNSSRDSSQQEKLRRSVITLSMASSKGGEIHHAEASIPEEDEANTSSMSQDENSPCTVQELENILTEPSGGFMMMPDAECNQIDEHIFIGEGDFAGRIDRLQRLKITHVLNAAHNKGVTNNPEMYEKAGMKFLGIEAMDTMGFDMSPFWEVAADVMESAVTHKGRIFVHCVQGISRSATLVIAYYMIKRHKSVREATKLVRARREICPNSNFLQQLCDLDEKLRASGHYEGK